MGPSSKMTSVLLRRGEKVERQTHTEGRQPCHDKDRDCSCTAVHQRTPSIVSGHQKLGEHAWPYRYPHFRLQASRTVAFSPPVCDSSLHYGNPRKLKHVLCRRLIVNWSHFMTLKFQVLQTYAYEFF